MGSEHFLSPTKIFRQKQLFYKRFLLVVSLECAALDISKRLILMSAANEIGYSGWSFQQTGDGMMAVFGGWWVGSFVIRGM